MTRLVADSLTLRRGGRKVVNSVSFIAEAGEFIAVIGPNGAGKSSLLSLLAGLTKPDFGTVSLDGVAIASLRPLQLAARRAWLPQNPRLEWPISVERLVALGLTPRLPATGTLPPQFAPAITRAMEMCDLADRRRQPATTLSGGEFARAMLARALVGDPDLLIVDEPIAGLDPRHAMDCMRLLADAAKAGKLVVAALHDLNLAARYASRFMVLVDGMVAGDTHSLTAELVHKAFGVRVLLSGQGDSQSFTLLSPSEK